MAQQLHRSHQELLDALALIGQGDMLDEINDAMNNGEDALGQTGKGYEITIKLKVEPNGPKKRVVSAAVTTKLPKSKPASTYLFMTEQGQLVANDPEQRELDLKQPNVTAPDFKKAAAGDR